MSEWLIVKCLIDDAIKEYMDVDFGNIHCFDFSDTWVEFINKAEALTQFSESL